MARKYVWKRKVRPPAKHEIGDSLPTRFKPRMLDELDARYNVSRELKRRFERLKADTGCDSYQKELLCMEAVWLATWLETIKVESQSGKPFPAGEYIQCVNALSGILTKLGLTNKAAENVLDLKTFVAQRGRTNGNTVDRSRRRAK